jgi:hypothetical protein
MGCESREPLTRVNGIECHLRVASLTSTRPKIRCNRRADAKPAPAHHRTACLRSSRRQDYALPASALAPALGPQASDLHSALRHSTLPLLGFPPWGLWGLSNAGPHLAPMPQRAGVLIPSPQRKSVRPLFLAVVAPPRRDDLTLWLFTETVKSFGDHGRRRPSAIPTIGIVWNGEVCRGSMPIHVRRPPRGKPVPLVAADALLIAPAPSTLRPRERDARQ